MAYSPNNQTIKLLHMLTDFVKAILLEFQQEIWSRMLECSCTLGAESAKEGSRGRATRPQSQIIRRAVTVETIFYEYIAISILLYNNIIQLYKNILFLYNYVHCFTIHCIASEWIIRAHLRRFCIRISDLFPRIFSRMCGFCNTGFVFI